MSKILICGDYCPQVRVACAIEQGHGESIAPAIRAYIDRADYSIVNLETSMRNNDCSPIAKCGPSLGCDESHIAWLRTMGFDGVTLANNHVLDYGEKGLLALIHSLDTNKLDRVGAGMNISEAQQVLYKEIAGIRIAFVNICEHEFSIATERSGGAAPLDVVDASRQIRVARNCADKVIVIVHGGSEHYQLPSPRMQNTYRFFVEMGADAVINHHQHCYSGYEIYQGKPIFYGLGNFCFDNLTKRNSIWNDGFMVMLDITRDNIDFELIPYRQCDTLPSVELLDDRSDFDTRIGELNAVIADEHLLKEKYESFVLSRNNILVHYMPYNSHLLRYMAKRGWLPSGLAQTKILHLINMINCEAHRDESLIALTNALKK